MHPAYIVHVTGLHPPTIRRHDLAQLRHWQTRTVLGQQAIGPQSAAAVAAVA
jgi:hypothetical protein